VDTSDYGYELGSGIHPKPVASDVRAFNERLADLPMVPPPVAAGRRPTPPDANPKTRFGMAKPPMALIPSTALVHTAMAFGDGAAKYGPANWRKDPVSSSTYLNAALRHIHEWIDGEENDPVSLVHHLGHAMGCLAILIDAQACGSLLDDRPPAAPTADLIREKTRPLD
jgi:hypothetical protein